MRLLTRLQLALGRDPHLGTILERVAAVHGDRRLVEEAGSGLTLTAAEASDLVDRWAGAVAAKVEPGAGVVVALPNGYRQLLACVAVARAGAVPAPVSDRLRAREIDGIVEDSGAELVVRDHADLEGGEPLGEARPADPGAVGARFFTSGTTGRPKGAELTHRALVGQVVAAAALPTGFRRDEVVLALPVAHIMGFAVLLGLACAGIPVYQLPKFDADAVLDAIESRRATGFVGVPAMYRMLLEAGAEERDLSSVRVWGSGADVLPDDVARRAKRLGAAAHLPLVGDVGQATVVEGYGMVEAGAGAVAFRVSPPFVLPGLGGVLIGSPSYRFRVVTEDGTDARPGQVGELWVKGPGVLAGYQGDDEATSAVVTEDGWLRTGDLARRGPLRTFVLAGRAKDVIKSGGYSVYAVEVEAALAEHPDVAEAAVVGLPDERRGEVPAAAVRLRDGASATGDDIVAWARERLAGYKVPRTVRVVDDLPRTGTAKVRRNEVRDLLTGPPEPAGRR